MCRIDDAAGEIPGPKSAGSVANRFHFTMCSGVIVRIDSIPALADDPPIVDDDGAIAASIAALHSNATERQGPLHERGRRRLSGLAYFSREFAAAISHRRSRSA